MLNDFNYIVGHLYWYKLFTVTCIMKDALCGGKVINLSIQTDLKAGRDILL